MEALHELYYEFVVQSRDELQEIFMGFEFLLHICIVQ